MAKRIPTWAGDISTGHRSDDPQAIKKRIIELKREAALGLPRSAELAEQLRQRLEDLEAR